jgi:hypothetical protein
MMKTTLLAAVALLGLALAPAMAGEGQGNPFPSNFGTLTITRSLPQVADTGSQAYPDLTGRPGSDLPSLMAEVLPANGSEGAVQTANSLPRGAEEGMVAYAQARSVNAWMLAHSGRSAPALAAR